MPKKNNPTPLLATPPPVPTGAGLEGLGDGLSDDDARLLTTRRACVPPVEMSGALDAGGDTKVEAAAVGTNPDP
jgi:hypothetical protein